MYLAQRVSHNKNRLPSGDEGRLEGEEQLREATLQAEADKPGLGKWRQVVWWEWKVPVEMQEAGGR